MKNSAEVIAGADDNKSSVGTIMILSTNNTALLKQSSEVAFSTSNQQLLLPSGSAEKWKDKGGDEEEFDGLEM